MQMQNKHLLVRCLAFRMSNAHIPVVDGRCIPSSSPLDPIAMYKRIASHAQPKLNSLRMERPLQSAPKYIPPVHRRLLEVQGDRV